MINKYYISRHYDLFSRQWLLAVTAGSLLSGIIMGCLGTKALTDQQLAGFSQEVNALLTMINQQSLRIFFNEALIKHEVWLIKCFLLGTSFIGLPMIMALIFTKGFGLGYTLGVIMNGFSAGQGLLVILTGVLPHNILAVPLCIVAAFFSANLSLDMLEIVRNHGGNIRNPLNLRLGLLIFGCLLLGIGAAFIEGWLSPLLIRFFLF